MSKIVLIATNEEMYENAKTFKRSLKDKKEFEIYLAFMDGAVKLAKKFSSKDVCAIICRGASGQMLINSGIKIPVIDMPLTDVEVMQTLQKAKNLSGVEHPNIAFVGYSNTYSQIKEYLTAIDISIKHHYIDDEKDNKKIIMLPGPPKEMRLMFENHVKDLVHDDFNIISKSINTTGIGESSLESRLQELSLSSSNINIATYAKEGTVEIKIVGKGRDKHQIELEVDAIINSLNKEFKSFIYGYDNISLEEVVVNELRAKGYKLGLCESCTGGLVSSMITRVPGASNVLERAIVSYSNTSKMEVLHVKASTLEKFGAVSEKTAYEMAHGLFNKSELDIVVSITGIAGPDGGSYEKPVGLVYFCIITKDGHEIIKSNFNGNRDLIQRRAAIKALNEIRKICINNN